MKRLDSNNRLARVPIEQYNAFKAIERAARQLQHNAGKKYEERLWDALAELDQARTGDGVSFHPDKPWLWTHKEEDDKI